MSTVARDGDVGGVFSGLWVRLAVAVLLALAFAGFVFGLGTVLGKPFADDDEPGAHLGGLAAPEFASITSLMEAVEQAGVPCPDPAPIEDPYVSYAEDQVYPPTEALRCPTGGGSLVLFLYGSSDDRIDVYEQGVIQTQACTGVGEPGLDVAHSVAGANWRVTSVGSDLATRLVGYFDSTAVEEPLSCYAEY